MRIKLATPLVGEFPRYANVKLPDNAAVTAQNMRFDSGVLKPLNGYTQGATLALTGHNINSIHLWKVGGNAYWLRFADTVNVIRSPIADDSYSRIYWSGDTRMGGSLIVAKSLNSCILFSSKVPCSSKLICSRLLTAFKLIKAVFRLPI